MRHFTAISLFSFAARASLVPSMLLAICFVQFLSLVTLQSDLIFSVIVLLLDLLELCLLAF